MFPVKESKGKKLPRVVYLPDTAIDIVKRLADAYPTGAIFRNADGVPWKRYAINCAFIRLEKKSAGSCTSAHSGSHSPPRPLKNGVT